MDELLKTELIMKSINYSNVSRRQFVQGSALAAGGVVFGLNLPGQLSGAPAERKGKSRLASKLYSLREECKTDLPGMLAAVSKIGYKGVELRAITGARR